MKQKGCRLFVVTNKPDIQARRIVTQLYGEALFDRIDGPDRYPVKPDPRADAVCAGGGGYPMPARAAFVGDSGVDILTARAAGMYSVGVLWGFRDRKELLEVSGADTLASIPQELPNILFSEGIERKFRLLFRQNRA